MVRFYGMFSAVGILVSAALILLMGAMGSRQPVHPALVNESECEFTCWWGIEAGRTNLWEAQTLLELRGYQLISRDEYGSSYTDSAAQWFCNVDLFHLDEIVVGITLYSCKTIYLGELISSFGTPAGINYSRRFPEVAIALGVKRVVIEGVVLSMYSPVVSLEIDAPFLAVDSCDYAWHGFVPLWRYSQLRIDFSPPDAC